MKDDADTYLNLKSSKGFTLWCSRPAFNAFTKTTRTYQVMLCLSLAQEEVNPGRLYLTSRDPRT